MFSISFAPIPCKVGYRIPCRLPECAPQNKGLVSMWVTYGDILGREDWCPESLPQREGRMWGTPTGCVESSLVRCNEAEAEPEGSVHRFTA